MALRTREWLTRSLLADLIVWRSHAEVCSLMTFLGFHAVDEKDRRKTTLSAEIKKRMYHHVYSMSMIVTPFTGRPPLVSKRYARTPLPLDIQDDALFSDTDTLRKAVGRLDERGWNTDGEIYAVSRVRARSILGAIREEILEIALSNNPVATIDTLLYVKLCWHNCAFPADRILVNFELVHCRQYLSSRRG